MQWLTCVIVFWSAAASAGQAPETAAPMVQPSPEYVLGPGDQLRIWALAVEEISTHTYRIDGAGLVDLPVLGGVKAGGLTLGRFRKELLDRLAGEVRTPMVSVDIVEFGSQPISVIGAVAQPGVHQLHGRRTLIEALSLAGGLRTDAADTVKITRSIDQGHIPLPDAAPDSSGKFTVAAVKLRELMSARNPAENILIRPHDVITVPSAEMVYVIGAVRKPGAFVLNGRETVSVLQALSMAEGLGSTPAPQHSRILRSSRDQESRLEIPVDVRKILAGKGEDVVLRPNDILFVPTSAPKRAALRAIEAAIQTGTGIAVWRR